MEKCNYTEGYLLLYASDGDEIHANLISEEHYKRILSKDTPDNDEEAFSTEPLYSWFSQTMCNEPWPYRDVKILGTVHVWCI